MDRYRITFDSWNKVAKDYADSFMDLSLYNDSYQTFYNALSSPNPRVLEVGCGPGNVAKHLLTQYPEVSWLGIDIAPQMIAIAQENNPRAQFKEMDGRHISTLNIKFDGIICGFFIPYISPLETRAFIEDCHALLNPNGVVYLSFVHGEPDTSGYITGSQGDQMYFYYHQKSQLYEDLKNQGFQVLNMMQLPYTKKVTASEIHTIIIAQKINQTV